MKPSIQKLQKFFKLEADRGYDNHAVLGGLERMLDLWVPEARLDGVPEDLIQVIVTRIQDYARLTEKSRAKAYKDYGGESSGVRRVPLHGGGWKQGLPTDEEFTLHIIGHKRVKKAS